VRFGWEPAHAVDDIHQDEREEPFQEVRAEQHRGNAAGQRAERRGYLKHHRQTRMTEAAPDVDRAGGRRGRDHADDARADRGLDRYAEEAGE
jgi:hypothetical protein